MAATHLFIAIFQFATFAAHARSAPNVALRSPCSHGDRMFHGQPGLAYSWATDCGQLCLLPPSGPTGQFSPSPSAEWKKTPNVLWMTFALESDPDPSLGGGACITSLMVLMDHAQVKRGGGKLGPGWAAPPPPQQGGGVGAPPFVVLTDHVPLFVCVADISAKISSLRPSMWLAVIRSRGITVE